MGLTMQTVTVRPSRGSSRHQEVEFLVDSGAVYSLVPAGVLRKLGLRPYRTESFTLADGLGIGNTATKQIAVQRVLVRGDFNLTGQVSASDVGRLLLGTVVAMVVAWISIGWLLRYVAGHSFVVFGIYRLAAGALVLALVAAGWL